LKNLKNNFLNKTKNKGLESPIKNIEADLNEKIDTLKNYREIADIPEIKNLFSNNNKNTPGDLLNLTFR